MQMPVIDEADVVVVLPFVGIRLHAFLEQRNRQFRPAGAAGIRLRQKDGAEAVRHHEVRIERRGEIEERIQQRIALRRLRMKPVVAVMLNRPDPVDVSQQRVVRQRKLVH